jgi:hypothetical protein
MDWQTLLGYAWLDSVMRHTFTNAERQSFMDNQSPDSIKQVARYVYAMSDYDPILFRQYLSNGQFINTSYWGYPSNVIELVQERVASILGDSSKIPYLLNSSYILHIFVQSVTIGRDSLAGVPGVGMPLCCIQAIVIDAIKGRQLPPATCDTLFTSVHRTGMDRQSPLSSGACLQFSYSPIWSKTGSDLTSGFYDTNGSLILTENAMGWKALAAGHEYIVFLTSTYLDFDSTTSYFGLRPIMDGVGGIYEISSGKVADPLNFWGTGMSPDLSAFKAALRQRIWNIQHP